MVSSCKSLLANGKGSSELFDEIEFSPSRGSAQKGVLRENHIMWGTAGSSTEKILGDGLMSARKFPTTTKN
jgi:hypothetical protein